MKKPCKENQKRHLEKFINCAGESYDREPWHNRSRKIKSWRDSISKKLKNKSQKERLSKLCLPDIKLKRCCLKVICEDSSNSDLLCLVSVMAWGGRDEKNGVSLFENSKVAECIVGKIRNGSLKYLDAYEKFHKAQGKKFKGLGPAFYTKLIFFCGPKHEGYIMDQWVSKSINLLMDEEIVNIEINEENADYVTNNNNDVSVYNRLCKEINKLKLIIKKRLLKYNWSGEEIEKALFSNDGKYLSSWRKHVKKEYPLRFPNKKPKGNKK